MNMKLTNRHLAAAVTLLLASILYNAWIFWGPSSKSTSRTQPVAPPASQAAVTAGTTGAPPMVNPMTMPAPSRLDLAVAPTWDRDPFRLTADSSTPPAVAPAIAAVAPVVEPVIGAILFSPERRLAIVNGKIVAVGDQIASGAIVDITRDAVLVRGAMGERRFLLAGPRRRELPK